MDAQPEGDGARGPGAGLLTTLWIVVAIECVLPVPGILTIGAALVLATRPAWFPALVDELYGRRG